MKARTRKTINKIITALPLTTWVAMVFGIDWNKENVLINVAVSAFTLVVILVTYLYVSQKEIEEEARLSKIYSHYGTHHKNKEES